MENDKPKKMPPKLNIKRKTSAVPLRKETVRVVLQNQDKSEAQSTPSIAKNPSSRVKLPGIKPLPKLQISGDGTSSTGRVPPKLVSATGKTPPPSVSGKISGVNEELERTRKVVLPPPGSPSVKSASPKTIPLKRAPIPSQAGKTQQTVPLKRPTATTNQPPQATIKMAQQKSGAQASKKLAPATKGAVKPISKTSASKESAKKHISRSEAESKDNPHLRQIRLERTYWPFALVSMILSLAVLILVFGTYYKIQ